MVAETKKIRSGIMTVQKRRWVRMALICGLAAMQWGCGSTNGGKKNGDDVEYLTDPEALPGDFPLLPHERADDDHLRVPGVQFENVHFAFDSSVVGPSEMPKIEAVAAWLLSNPRTRLVVEGHCDERGSREYNMALGEYRALAVRANLIRFGVEPTRVQTRSYGSERPLDPAHNESAWRVNRRAEFILYRE
jgi:peptidoglycan-associated lipoprotein